MFLCFFSVKRRVEKRGGLEGWNGITEKYKKRNERREEKKWRMKMKKRKKTYEESIRGVQREKWSRKAEMEIEEREG